jgi:hypothetical protein
MRRGFCPARQQPVDSSCERVYVGWPKQQDGGEHLFEASLAPAARFPPA